MKYVDRKPSKASANYFYGVDVNDKVAVQNEFERLKKQHRIVTIVVIIALAILSIVFFDFLRVNYIGGKPIFAIENKVEHGTMFSGLGYKVLYCDNGERYTESVLYKSCGEIDQNKFSNVLYERLVEYSVDNKMIDKNNLEFLRVNNFLFDEYNDEGGSDYHVNVSFSCNDGTSNCFKTKKEFYDIKDADIYVRFNKFNEVYDIIYFKNSGEQYKKLSEIYEEKIKEYMINNNMINIENLRSYSIKLIENSGRYVFRDNVYPDSYLVEINYLCNDNGNSCVEPFDRQDQEGDFSNLSFYASVFVDMDDNVILVGPKEYLKL